MAKKITAALIKRFEKYWGVNGWEAYARITQEMEGRGFVNLTTYEPPITTMYFGLQVTDTIKANILCSTVCRNEQGEAYFDASLFLESKTAYDKTISTDPWSEENVVIPVQDIEWSKGFVHCCTIGLAHLVWCENIDSPINPIFRTFENSEDDLKFVKLFPAIDRIFMPIINSIKSDQDLIDFLKKGLSYKKPAWVLSNGIYVVDQEKIIECLQR